MVSFQESVENPHWKGTIWENGKVLQQKGTLTEKYKKSETKLLPFQWRAKIQQIKWYHFRKFTSYL